MTQDELEAVRASAARIQADAARLMVEHPEFTVNQCIWLAAQAEAILYGVPGAPTPTGIMGHSSITRCKP